MMSSFSMQSGARARDRKKCCGLSGCRTLMWPNEIHHAFGREDAVGGDEFFEQVIELGH